MTYNEIVSNEIVIILDFGSQYTQLIARKVRELQIYCEILPFNTPIVTIKSRNPKAIILSGGPSSIYTDQPPQCDNQIFNLGIPILGICYGMQAITHSLGGSVSSTNKREFGSAEIIVKNKSKLFIGLPDKFSVWMSHSDHAEEIPQNFEIVARSSNSLAAIENTEMKFYGLQFHPEVSHTNYGKEILENFLVQISGLKQFWNPNEIIEKTTDFVKKAAENSNVICGLSGGIDSTVAAVLVQKAIGNKLTCIFVDNGLLRLNEFEEVLDIFRKHLGLNVIGVKASDKFLDALAGVTDPEKKRKIIGHEFIQVFEAEAKKIGNVEYLVQGTLYPDVIESISVNGPSATIKSHHNVGGLPKDLKFKLLEPLRELFKDEVRSIATNLNIPEAIIRRQPFPGPGLAIRIIGEVTTDRIKLLQFADKIVKEEIVVAGLYNQLWQAFAVLLPIQTVGVMGDQRTYENTVAIRAVTSQDGMTADWARLPYEILHKISSRIVSEVKGINRVVYDISSKPPSTIEWE